MGGKSSTTKVAPYKGAQPGIDATADAGLALFQQGKLAPDNVGFGAASRDAQDRLKTLGRDNAITSAAVGGLGDFLGAERFQPTGPIEVGSVAGPEAYGAIPQNAGIDAVRNNVLDTVLPEVASMFGRGGFTNSTVAQQAAADAATSALAPYEYDQFNTNRALDISQFNTDQNRRLAFDVNERDTALNQANLDRADAFDRELAGAQTQLSGLGLAPSVNSLQYGDVNALLGLGEMRDQNRLANQSNDANEIIASANLFSQLGGLGQSQSQTPSTLQTLGGLGQLGTSAALAASLLCDRRLKRDIVPVGEWRGVALYVFRYLWDDVLRIGPMAQEVPERARVKVGDFYAVDMGAL